jgi:hypothetical protein
MNYNNIYKTKVEDEKENKENKENKEQLEENQNEEDKPKKNSCHDLEIGIANIAII